jgi:Fe-S cluster assembly protein SufD
MTETFGPSTIERLAKQLREPAWVTDLRRRSLDAHARLPWPHASDDIWRRTDVSLLDPARGFAPPQDGLLNGITLSDKQLERLTRPFGNEALFVRVNGAWTEEPKPSGFSIEPMQQAAGAPGASAEALRRAIEADGLTDAEQKLAALNLAFHHDDLVVRIPPGASHLPPIRLVRIASLLAHEAMFPMTIVTVAAGSSATIIDEYASVQGRPQEPGPHLINGRIELIVEPGASLHYVRLQRWDAEAREFLFQRATLGQGASLTMANINLGAALSKAHVVTKLNGPEASAQLYGFVFGHGKQHIDQHTLQDHQAPRTTSDLQVKAALQDESRMVYTGLIRIAAEAQQTSAYQANHNLLLNSGAQAETIPMLEILADDVQCKHGASIGPIDEEQVFYLLSRGVPRAAAERLVVMGFIESIIQQIPFEPLQERLREEIEQGIRNG